VRSRVATAALAANSTSFVDPTGDAYRAPDLTSVSISSDDSENVTVRITVGNRSALFNTDSVWLLVDTDQNPDSGTTFYGTEFAILMRNGDFFFLRAAPSGHFAEAPVPSSVHASFAGTVATFSFSVPEVGILPSSGFNIFAVGGASGYADTAPDDGTFNDQLVKATPAPTLLPDTRAPLDTATSSTGRHGRLAQLHYFAEDGRGETADTFTIYRGKRLLTTFLLPLRDRNPWYIHFAYWRVPRSARGKLRFCVSSVDRAGNKSNTSCAPLIIS